MAQKLVAIHQPNFFPWLGYFNKIARADCFVFLDHVRMNPKQTWFTRVQILNQREPRWLSIPVMSEDEDYPRIDEVKVNPSTSFWLKHLRTIQQNYRSHPYFSETFPLIEQFYQNQEPLLAKRNIQFIRSVCDILEIRTQIVCSSDHMFTSSSTDLLIEIVKYFGGTSYLCGGGAEGYQENHKFEEQQLDLVFQGFHHPIYSQAGSDKFLPGLSILDVLMNCGRKQTRDLILSASCERSAQTQT